MRVGEEEEVGPHAFGDRHGAGDGADVRADGGEEADLFAVDEVVEFADLLGFGRFVVVLFGDGGVGFGGDLLLGELFGHLVYI